MFRVLVCPTAYKGSFGPLAAAQAIAAGIQQTGQDVEVSVLPLADGGDGTIESLQSVLGGQLHKLQVHNALDEPASAAWLKLPEIAVVELANACGLARLKKQQLEPLRAHTMGAGEVLLDCLHKQERNIVVTLGGSASTDGGTGLLRALGAKFFDVSGNELPLGGGYLNNLHSCDLSALERWRQAQIQVAVDVVNPLLGNDGAAAIFAPQKGATLQEVQVLEKGLSRLAVVLESASGKSCRDIPGAGAAGGTAFGLACALQAEIVSGFNWLSQMLNLDNHIGSSNLIISGEGRLDSQSMSGKAMGELARKCKNAGARLWVLPAQAELYIDWTKHGIERVVTVAQPGQQADLADLQRVASEVFVI